MKIYLTAFLYLIIGAAIAQKIPESTGVNRVRLVAGDKTILAELMPGDSWAPVNNEKTYYWYSANAIHTTQGGYSGKLLQGSYNEYFLNKNLKEQGNFLKGLKNGLWKKWNENGVLLESVNWADGFKRGKFEVFDEKGMLKQAGAYRDDLLNGQVKNYISADSVQVVTYHNGKLITETKHTSFWQKVNVFKHHPNPGKKSPSSSLPQKK
ncbi:hypothetical protein HQ865_15255 [Mucilaginibacter mali]|uniref:MORN repeat protein n=1 Tax=Mucilaginibacter mali TaxID=2740462 RepID=A0A7D4TNK5_9SPHI|nr:hypothetical protein [Mucilaginibacter mali]QKJ31053.1 hypothetical protein HQ865_15255 [Mucilaginibacter mali]